jgi:streptomycin 6-kinase
MPYFIYRIFQPLRLEPAAQFATFPQASAEAKVLRRDPGLPPDCRIKVIFAEHAAQAEDLLSQVREAGPLIGDDD